MKKLLSVVLVLAMLASMCIYLPMGVTAAEPAATPIYAEDFADMDGTYTLGELAELLGWTLLRGEETAEATIADGALTIDTTALATDVVFEMETSTALKANHTIQYDLVMGAQNTELANYKLFFAGVYTGTDNGETVKAVIDKTTYEGYNHMALVDGNLNEGNIWVAAYKIGGGDHGQCRPENIPGGATNNTWKTVVDVTNNQVDSYASGGRMNSTVGGQNDSWAKYNVADYVGEGAYLRVQLGRVATFDNISIVTGGDAIVSTSNVLYNQTFDGITYDAENETSADLAAKIGFQTLNATAKTNTDTATMKYAINDGRLEILAVPADGQTASGMNGNQQGLFGTLFLPEMENAKEAVVIEYDMTYLYDANQTGSLNHGDAPFSIEMYGRRGDFEAWWMFTQKGFPFYGFRNGSYSESGTAYYPNSYGFNSTSTNGMPQTMGRWEDTYFKANAGAYNFSNNAGYGNSIYNSTESIKVVLDYDQGMFIYTNDILAFQLSQSQLETWLSTKGTANSKHTDIIGNIFKFRATSGCHVALDNIKVTVDPEKVAGPDLWLTEHSVGTTGGTWCTLGGMEYVEVYNASTEAINIYDYALTQRAYNGSCDNVGTAIGLDNITLAYPGTHTFKSIKLADDGINPLYTYDVTNPAYADGWLQPGEVAMLWNKTDSMHNGGYGSPSVVTTADAANYGMGNYGHMTEADFRTALSLDENVKVFAMYNDYNRAFNNSGSHFVALVDRALVQPSYNPATNSGDETLNNANIGFAEYKSSILDVTADTNSIRTIKTVHYASYDVANGMGYSSVVFGRPVSSTNNDTASMTAGYLTDAQKKTFTVTFDGKATPVALGEDFSYAYTTEVEAPKFYKELFAVVDGDIVMADDPAYGTIENVKGEHTVQRYKVAMTTVPGVGIRFGGQNDANWDQSFEYSDVAAGLRWITGIKASHIDQLMNSGLVANVEIGTLITRDGAALDETAKKVVAYNGYWFSETADANYADMTFFAGSVANMYVDNYVRDYKGVGYVTVTLTNSETVTVTGDYVDANESNVLAVIEAAQMDPENGLTPEEMDVLNEYYAQYYGE